MAVQRNTHRVRETYAFIKAHRKEFGVQLMCRVLGVARSAYYEWLRHPKSDRAREDERLLRPIRASYAASHGVYGGPRIFLDLREAGETCSKHRVARLKRVNKIRAAQGYRAPRYVQPKTSALIPNTLQRGFEVAHPNKAWETDITLFEPGRAGCTWPWSWICSRARS